MEPRREACSRCIVTCSVCITSFLLMENEADRRAIRRCRDLCGECMDTCRQMLDLLEHESRYVESYGPFCAAMCRLCASECGRHQTAECQDCKKTCEECARVFDRRPAPLAPP